MAWSFPAIVDVVEPVTRFRIAEEEFGWLKVTPLAGPIEKLPQLTMARGDVWLTVMEPPTCPIDAAPDVTTPWLGRMFWAWAGPKANAIAAARPPKAAGGAGESRFLGNGIL